MLNKKSLLFTLFLIMLQHSLLFSGEYYYPIHDHLGSVRVVVDKNANVVEAFDYYPFGAELRSTVNDDQAANLRFTGKELDKESHIGLYYFGARYYDPEVGRFISVDPLADKYPGLTPYHYAANNPLMFVDPDGKAVGIAIGGVILGAGELVFLGLTATASVIAITDPDGSETAEALQDAATWVNSNVNEPLIDLGKKAASVLTRSSNPSHKKNNPNNQTKSKDNKSQSDKSQAKNKSKEEKRSNEEHNRENRKVDQEQDLKERVDGTLKKSPEDQALKDAADALGQQNFGP